MPPKNYTQHPKQNCQPSTCLIILISRFLLQSNQITACRLHFRRLSQISRATSASPAATCEPAAFLNSNQLTVIAQQARDAALVVVPDTDAPVALGVPKLDLTHLSSRRGWSSLSLSFFWFYFSSSSCCAFLSYFSLPTAEGCRMDSWALPTFLGSTRCEDKFCLLSRGPETRSFSRLAIYYFLTMPSSLELTRVSTLGGTLFSSLGFLLSACFFCLFFYFSYFTILFLRLISKGVWLSSTVSL